MRGPTASSRTIVLGASAMIAFSRSAAYSPSTARPALTFLSPAEAWLPLSVWAWIWAWTGIMLVVSIFVRRISIWSMTTLAGLMSVWGGSYIWEWLFGDATRSWITGCLFMAGAMLVGALATMLERGR